MTLPGLWPLGRARRLRLTRRFRRPRLDKGIESLCLRLQRVPGLDRITLNGAPLPLQLDNQGSTEIELPDLPERNLLVLDVSLPEADPAGSVAFADWGQIALLVRIATV
jgi:hypothetical protein